MDKRFVNIPTEKDTKIISRNRKRLKGFDIYHERWDWEGIKAESIIFWEEDVAHLSDEDLIEMVTSSPYYHDEGDPTISRRRQGYCFVNLNFKI